MPDINLLPEDLKKKINSSYKNRGAFNLEDIEFTEGERLKKDKKLKVDLATKNKFKKWFYPQTKNQFKSQKTKTPRSKDNYNTLNRDDFLEEQDIKSDKPLPFKKKKRSNQIKKFKTKKGPWIII